MRKLLIISPRFAPWTSADNQRVLQMLPHLAGAGWQAFVAAVDCNGMGLPEDPELARRNATLAACRWARPRSLRWSRRFGITSLGLRSAGAMDRLVRDWHRQERFDLVFVSHTEFGLWHLAPAWWRDLRIPYVLDWQDPWYSDYYRQHPAVRPPGGRIKFALMQWLARWREPEVARRAAAHVCVSSFYGRMLRGRYPQIPASAFSVIPFASSVGAEDAVITARAAPRGRYWAYAGRGGPDMAFALRGLFSALASQRARAPAQFADLRLKFVGTSYADPARAKPSVGPIAEQYGVADLVEESPLRINPAAVRELLDGAEALLLPGSDDPGYVASKLQSLLAMAKPMLAIVHADGDLVAALQGQAGVVVCGFADSDAKAADALAKRIEDQWMSIDLSELPLHPRRLADHSPQAMTRQLAAVFDRACR